LVEGKFGLGKPTEMTIRDLLQDELKRKGVVVVPEVSYRSLDGRRLAPDLVLKNGAQYVVETKLGVRKSSGSRSILYVRLNRVEIDFQKWEIMPVGSCRCT
jgi:hypothetical protein